MTTALFEEKIAAADAAFAAGELDQATQLYAELRSDEALPKELVDKVAAQWQLIKLRQAGGAMPDLSARTSDPAPKADGASAGLPTISPSGKTLLQGPAGLAAPAAAPEAAPARPTALPSSNGAAAAPNGATTADLAPTAPKPTAPRTGGRPPKPSAGVAALVPPISAVTQAEAKQQTVQELAAEAQSYRARPTKSNFKAAIARYRQLLALSDLTPPQVEEYSRQLRATEQDYEAFEAEFGELTTARQLVNQEGELIALRKLIISGQTIGPDGEELEGKFETLLTGTRENQAKQARAEISLAEQLQSEGVRLLDPEPLAEAEQSYQRAIDLLQGTHVGAAELNDANTPQATKLAIRSIPALLKTNEVDDLIQKYTESRNNVTKQRELIQRVLPDYRTAEQLFTNKSYAEAATILKKLQNTVDTKFHSKQIDFLNTETQSRWEQAVVTKADQLLEQARTAQSRGAFSQVEELVSTILDLDQQLESEKFEGRKQQARALNEEVRQGERDFRALLEEARQLRRQGKLDEAETKIRTAIAQRPTDPDAREVFDQVLQAHINLATQQADRALAAPTRPTLEAARERLEQQRGRIGDLGAVLQKRLTEQLQTSLTQLGNALTRITERERGEAELNRLLKQVREQLDSGEYQPALATLAKVKERAPTHQQLDTLTAEAGQGWASALRSEARSLIDAVPPNPSAALKCLTIIREQGLEDTSSASLREQVERLLGKEQGLRAFEQGDFKQALIELGRADISDPEVKSTLRSARRKEAERLMSLREWARTIEVLNLMDAAEPGNQGLLGRARSEQALVEAERLRAAKEFGAAEQQLSAAEREHIDDITERSKVLRSQITADRAVFIQAQQLQVAAVEQYGRFDQTQNRRDLQDALHSLDKALALPDLRADDSQRAAI